MFLLSYCAINERVEPNNLDMESMLTAYNQDPINDKIGEIAEGKVIFAEVDGVHFISIIKNDKEKVHTAFFYQTDNPVFTERIINKGKVLYTAHSIYVQDWENNHLYRISINKLNNLNEQGVRFTEVYNAYGIGKTTTMVEKNRLEQEGVGGVGGGVLPLAKCECLAAGIIPIPACDAGGPGTNFCSIQACSATCAAGFFSCCTL